MMGRLRSPSARRRRQLVAAAIVAIAGAATGSLLAYFTGSVAAGSAGAAVATSVDQGTPPTSVTVHPGRSVTLNWASATLANGHAVDGYVITRYDANAPYAPQLTLPGCTGVIAALTCTEGGVPFGSWQYTVTPVIGANWLGLESTKSGTVTIGAASLTLDRSTLGLTAFGSGSNAATLTGALSGFASNEGITFRLDDPSSGAVLSGSPAHADSSGNASVSVSLPRPADGPHSIFALGDGTYPSQASAAILVDTTPPTSSAAGTDSAWHATDVTVALSATDGTTGSGVNHLSYQVDGGPLQTISGASGNVVVGAPADGSNDGVHTITFFATDNADNVEAPAQSVTVKIDTTKPTTSLSTSPATPDGANGWFKQASVQFTLSGSDARSGVAATYYRVDGGAVQTYSGAVTISSQGDHTVEYWSVDNAGNTEAANTTHIKLDNVKPATTIAVGPASPNGSGGWYVSTPTFTLSGSDTTSGVASTSYQIDGGATQIYSGAVAVPDGQHTITYWSTDSAGNDEDHHTSATIKVDTVKPTTSIVVSPSSPDGSNGWRVSATTFTLSASDASSGVASTFYKIDGGTTQTFTGAAVSIPQGSHTVSYWSVDVAGNTESATTSGAIKVDTVKPSTSIATTPAAPDGSNDWFQRSSVTFTLSASDATSGVANSFYTIDGGGQQTYSSTVTISTQGDHTVTYWSVDSAGNTETASTTHIKLDNVKPSTTLTTAPASPDGSNNWFKRASVTFTLAATDATSGVANRFYTIDSGGQQTYSGTVTISTQGDHTVTYWSVDSAGNTETTNTTHVKLDNVTPTNALSLVSQSGGGSLLTGSTVYYRGSTAGSFKIRNAVSDATSGAGSSTFAALGGTTTGWTHSTPDVQTTPSGGPYDSNTFSWTSATSSSPSEVVTGADAAGNSTAAPTLTFTNDSTAPSTTDNTASIGSTCKNSTQTVTLTPTDGGSGVAATYYTTDGSTPTTGSSQGTSIALSSDGTYTIKYFSVDKVGNTESVRTAATTICIDKTAPAPTNVVLANGGIAGTADSGDTLTVTYSEQLDATTFCSTWTNSGTQTLSNTSIRVQIANNSTNDTLTITAVGSNCGGTANFHFGSVALGGNYVSTTRTFGSSLGASQITWDPSARTLTIKLGLASGAVSVGVSAGTPTYTPSSSLTDIAGNTINTNAFSAPGTSRF
jgi:Chitobiase/beta-hexosaminidase C-terminal domain